MTTITRIGVATLELPLRAALRWGKASEIAHFDHRLIGVELDGAVVGVAEVAVRPTIYGETTAGIEAALRLHLAPAMIGLDADDERATHAALRVLPFNFALRGALDLALCEARARRDGLDLARQHLGPSAHVRVSYILGIAPLAAMLADARHVVDAGVRVLKVKVGRDASADEKVLGALQAEFGDTVLLYADANEAWTAAEAPARLERLAHLGVAYVEEPLPVERLRERAALRALEILPIIADDSCFGFAELERELDANTFDILNIKTARSGWRESLQLLERARAAGKGVMVGSQASSGLGTLHAAVLASQAGITHPNELSFPLRLELDSLDRPPPIHEGTLDVARYAQAKLRPELWQPRWC